LHKVDRQPGRLVIAGGGLSADTESVHRATLAGRQGSGPLCVIPTASGDVDGAIDYAVDLFNRYGGPNTAVGIRLSVDEPAAVHDDAIVARIRGCSGFWFSGGVQSRTVRLFRPDGGSTPAYEALLQRHADGAVVGGSSAGAAIMSDPMIAGGSTTGALARGASRDRAERDEEENDDYAGGGISITTGLGFLGPAIVDQHFLARGRIGRLITAVLDLEEYDVGFGIDENTALIVDGDTAYALGGSGVIALDTRAASRDGRSATGVRLHLLGHGDRFIMSTGRFEAAPGRSAPARSALPAHPPDDIFARWRFLHLLDRLARSDEQAVLLDHGFAAFAGTARACSAPSTGPVFR
jgi:cyanophycinase